MPQRRTESAPTPPRTPDVGEPRHENGRLTFTVGTRERRAAYRSDDAPSQDASFIDTSAGVFVVCDGMGGGGGNPEAAARVAAKTVGEGLAHIDTEDEAHIEEKLEDIFEQAREAVLVEGEGGSAVVTAVKVYETAAGSLKLAVAHAGDTRLIIYNKKTKDYREATTDQSTGNVVYNGFFSNEPSSINDEYMVLDVSQDDRFMLCSDGITGDTQDQSLSRAEFLHAFGEDSPDAAAQRFVELSRKVDDKTVVVVDIDRRLATPKPTGQSGDAGKKGYAARQKKRKNTVAAAAVSGSLPHSADKQSVPSEQEVQEQRLNELRDAMAAAAAKRQGRLFGRGSESYEATERAYTEQLQNFGRMKLEGTLADTAISDSDKNTIVIAYLFDEQKALREKTKELLADTKVGKMVDWMTSGSKTMRFAKGVLVGVGAGAVGAGAAAVIGAGAGAGALVAGAATMGIKSTARFARSFARRDAAGGRGMDDIASETRDEMVRDSNESDRFGSLSAMIAAKFEEDTQVEQQKRRKSVRAGLGGVALGAVGLGVAAQYHGEIGEAVSSVRGWFSVASNTNVDVTPTPEPGAGEPTEASGAEPDQAPAQLPGADSSPEVGAGSDGQDGVSHEVSWADHIEVHPDASVISSGEGWYQTFHELNIPQEHWAALLHDAGPGLVDLGIAYEDPAIGGYGIFMTPDGTMPVEALEHILDTAEQHEFIDAPVLPEATDVAVGSDAMEDTSLDMGNPAPLELAEVPPFEEVEYSNAVWDVEHGEGWYQTFHEMGIPKENWGVLLQSAGPDLATLRYDNGLAAAYYDGFRQEWRINMPPNGQLSEAVVELLHHTAYAHNWAPAI